MFNLKARGSLADPKDASKPALKPALYDPPGTVARAAHGTPSRSQAPGHTPHPRRRAKVCRPHPRFRCATTPRMLRPRRTSPRPRRRTLPRRRPGASSSSG